MNKKIYIKNFVDQSNYDVLCDNHEIISFFKDAVAKENFTTLERLVSTNNIEIINPDFFQNLALAALERGHYILVNFLLSCGMDGNVNLNGQSLTINEQVNLYNLDRAKYISFV